MTDGFLFFLLPPDLFDDDAVLADFQQPAFVSRSVLEEQLHLATHILPVLPVQFQGFVKARRGDFQGKFARRKKSRRFQLPIQRTVELDAFFDRNALIAIDKDLDVIGWLQPDLHQEIPRFRLQHGLDQTFYRFNCLADHESL